MMVALQSEIMPAVVAVQDLLVQMQQQRLQVMVVLVFILPSKETVQPTVVVAVVVHGKQQLQLLVEVAAVERALHKILVA